MKTWFIYDTNGCGYSLHLVNILNYKLDYSKFLSLQYVCVNLSWQPRSCYAAADGIIRHIVGTQLRMKKKEEDGSMKPLAAGLLRRQTERYSRLCEEAGVVESDYPEGSRVLPSDSTL